MQPQNVRSVDDAKALVKAEKAKIGTALHRLVTARVPVAIIAAFAITSAIAFGTHLIYARERLPTVGVSSAMLGLPPLQLDFGIAGEAATEAAAAAQRQGASQIASEFLVANPALVPLINVIGFGLGLALTFWAFSVQNGLRKRQRLEREAAARA